MIPVEQIQPGDIVTLPNQREMTISHVEQYGDDYIVVYKDGDLEKTMRIMRAGDLVNADRPGGYDDGGEPEHEAGRQFLLELYRRYGPMPDSEIVERAHERDADQGRTLTAVTTLMRRRRELERRDLLETVGERFHPESGATEPLWMVRRIDEPLTIAHEYDPEPAI